MSNLLNSSVVIFGDKLPTKFEAIMAILDGKSNLSVKHNAYKARVGLVASKLVEVFER